MNSNSTGSAVGWIALIIALIALALAWVAFNRSGTDFEQLMQEELETRTAEIQADFDRLESELRQETADELDEAATDVRTDEEESATTTE